MEPKSAICCPFLFIPLVIYYLNVNSSWSAADFSLLSVVHSCTPINWADAKRWISTKSTPFPIRWFRSIKNRNSSNSILGAIGSDWSKETISFRFFRLPQASSPIINGWQVTSASINSFSSCRLPWRRWVTQIDVSSKKFQPHFSRKTFLSILPTAVSGISFIISIILGAS